MSGTLIINGKDALATWGLAIATPNGWADLAEQRYAVQPVPRRQASYITGPVAEQPRTMSFSGFITGSSVAAMRANLDGLKAEISGRSVTLTTADYATRFLVGYATTAQLQSGNAPAMVAVAIPITIAFTAFDPYWYDTAQSSIALPASVPLGSAPIRPIFTTTFTGSRSSEVITLKDSTGTITYGSITISAAFVNGDVLVIDMDKLTVTKNGASILNSLSAGDFFAIDQAIHATYSTGTWPTVQSAAKTAGLANATIKYNKAWR